MSSVGTTRAHGGASTTRSRQRVPVSTRLPVSLARFIGREAELAEAAVLLADNRLLTLTGPGGAGKTRLAMQLADRLAGGNPDGVWFVDFSPLSGGEFVWDRVAGTLGVRGPGPGRTWAGAVGHYLASRRALVLLDNCEHVVESASEVAASLLDSARNVKILATCREPLGVGGEVTWAVPSLVEADAVDLFTDRARHALPQFKLRDDDRPAMLAICRRLDGGAARAGCSGKCRGQPRGGHHTRPLGRADLDPRAGRPGSGPASSPPG